MANLLICLPGYRLLLREPPLELTHLRQADEVHELLEGDQPLHHRVGRSHVPDLGQHLADGAGGGQQRAEGKDHDRVAELAQPREGDRRRLPTFCPVEEQRHALPRWTRPAANSSSGSSPRRTNAAVSASPVTGPSTNGVASCRTRPPPCR